MSKASNVLFSVSYVVGVYFVSHSVNMICIEYIDHSVANEICVLLCLVISVFKLIHHWGGGEAKNGRLECKMKVRTDCKIRVVSVLCVCL